MIKYQQTRLTRRASSCPLGNGHCCRKGTEFSKLKEDLWDICSSNCVCIVWFWKTASHPVWLGFCYCYGMLLGKVFSKAGQILLLLPEQQRQQNSTQTFCAVFLPAKPASDVKWVLLYSSHWMLAKGYQNSSCSKILLPLSNLSIVFLFPHPFLSHAVSCLL